MSVTPPENSATAPSGSPDGIAKAVDRVKKDKDIHAGLSTLKRVFIQVAVSLLSFMMATGAAFFVEKWLHFIETEMETNSIPIAPLFRSALPYISGGLLIGLSVIAMILAFREAWHLGRRTVEPERAVGVHQSAPVPTASVKPQPTAQPSTRAQRRRQNRH